jgi:hypothetical protein
MHKTSIRDYPDVHLRTAPQIFLKSQLTFTGKISEARQYLILLRQIRVQTDAAETAIHGTMKLVSAMADQPHETANS